TRRVRNLTQAELQYPSPQIELLNVAWAVKEFSDRLLPAFTVVLTHHWVLATYFSYRQTDSRVARWLVYLKPYRLIFKARPTKDSEVSQVLDDHLPTISCNVRTTDNNPRYNSQSSDSDDGDRESLGYAWKARYLVTDADQIRFIPYSLQISGRPRHDRAVY
ncbi:MAG: hypothetical protein GY696_02535, partial [Gammaproteobacteria bacterium]|nr:hypothetical protein [Gammaproteobacteria bacterium]